MYSTAVQSQKAVFAAFTSKQILTIGFAEQSRSTEDDNVIGLQKRWQHSFYV